jgi:hypothetical protein
VNRAVPEKAGGRAIRRRGRGACKAVDDGSLVGSISIPWL